MLLAAFFVSALAAGGNAYYLAEPVVNKAKRDAIYQGGWPLITSAACPANLSVSCGGPSNNNVIQTCCRTGDTCFGGSAPYCCPSTQDCTAYTGTFPVCVDPTANMFIGHYGGYFCCKNGLIAVNPSSGQGICQAPGGSIAASLLATMTSQIGGTAVTPFGGFGTATGAAAVSASGASVTNTAARNPTSGSTGATQTVSSGSIGSGSSSSGWNPGTGAIAGLAIAAAFLLGLFYITWSQCSKRRARRRQEALFADPMFGGKTSGYHPSSQVHQYMPPPQGRVSPVFGAAFTPHSAQGKYDPVNERVMSPATPSSPAPEYMAVDARELVGSGRAEVLEVPVREERRGGELTGRVEMG